MCNISIVLNLPLLLGVAPPDSPLFQALDGFLFVIWSTGRTIYVSEGITPLLGHLQSDLVGKNFLDLIHPEDVAAVRDRMFPVGSRNNPSHVFHVKFWGNFLHFHIAWRTVRVGEIL